MLQLHHQAPCTAIFKKLQLLEQKLKIDGVCPYMQISIDYDLPVVTTKKCVVEKEGKYMKGGRSKFLSLIESFMNNYEGMTVCIKIFPNQ